MIQDAITKLMNRQHLSPAESTEVMTQIAAGEATNAQIGSLLTALRMNGVTAEEITSFAGVMLSRAVPFHPRISGTMVDTCGTGGDHSSTFNISTTAAFVSAGAGVQIVKHGNRSVSSTCGSADVMEALGIRIDLPPETVCKIIEEIGIGFLFAPTFHPAMKHAAQARREIGFYSVFNILGPILNPAGAQARLFGVYDPALLPIVAEALSGIGTRNAMIVHGEGLDEITITGETKVAELKDGKIREYIITPETFGINRSNASSLIGRSVQENADIIRCVLAGEPGPKHDIVVMNAGAAIYLGGKAPDLKNGIKLAEESISSGAALEKMELLRDRSRAA